MSGAVAKLAGWMPQAPPSDQEELEAQRLEAVKQVTDIYKCKKHEYARVGFPDVANDKLTASLEEIFLQCQAHVTILRSLKKWKYRKHKKRWWDRRVNEAASPKDCGDGVPDIVSLKADNYLPSYIFSDEELAHILAETEYYQKTGKPEAELLCMVKEKRAKKSMGETNPEVILW